MAISKLFLIKTGFEVNIKPKLPFDKSLRIYQIVKKLTNLVAFAFVIAAFLLHIHLLCLIVSDSQIPYWVSLFLATGVRLSVCYTTVVKSYVVN